MLGIENVNDEMHPEISSHSLDTIPPPQVSKLGDQLSNMHLEAAEDGREEKSEDN